MTNHSNYVYMLYCFDKITEKLVYSQELVNVDPSELRRLFNPDSNVYPYLFDSFDIETVEQGEYIKQSVTGEVGQSMLANCDCFVEANSVK